MIHIAAVSRRGVDSSPKDNEHFGLSGPVRIEKVRAPPPQEEGYELSFLAIPDVSPWLACLHLSTIGLT